MSRQYCVLCRKEVEDHDWCCKNWGNVDGWACSKHFVPSPLGENIISSAFEQRKEGAKDLIQPYREGVPSQEFIDAYGTKNMPKDQISKAKYVWQDIPGIKNINLKGYGKSVKGKARTRKD